MQQEDDGILQLAVETFYARARTTGDLQELTTPEARAGTRAVETLKPSRTKTKIGGGLPFKN